MATPIAKPGVRIEQSFTPAPVVRDNRLRALILGGLADLHRYSVASEKLDILAGNYSREADAEYAWPAKAAGSLVDQAMVRVFLDNALLMYHEDLIGITTGGRGTVTPVSGYTNRVRSSTLAYAANGTSYPASAIFGDRGVKVGDRVYIRGVEDPGGECVEHELWTYVTGFAKEPVAGSVGAATADTGNQPHTVEAVSVEQIAGSENCVTASADASAYSGWASGFIEEVYTVEVVSSSVSGCTASRLRVTSASGLDDAEEVEVELDTPIAIGDRGLTMTFTVDGSPSCSSASEDEGIPAAELVVGQTWQVTVAQEFEAACVESSGDYAGDVDDTYIIEVTKGGLWDELPEITVSTARGLDASGPTVVSGDYTEVAVGTQGVLISFVDCMSAASLSLAAVGDSNLDGLRKGDKFYIPVVSSQTGRTSTLVLKHDLPDEILTAEDLDLRLFISDDIEVDEARADSPTNPNWESEATQLVTKADMSVFHPEWTVNSAAVALPVWGGDLYLEYREWLTDGSQAAGEIATAAEAAALPGPLDPLNPLKYAVNIALSDSDGSSVFYLSVSDPDDATSWSDALGRLSGLRSAYNIVPLTDNKAVWTACLAYASTESSPTRNNYKGVVVGVEKQRLTQVVGADASSDGEVVLAKVLDDPQATGVQYTRVRITTDNIGLLEAGVRAGDVLRYGYRVDTFGNVTYSTATIDSVSSENTCLLTAGLAAAINQAQKIEIWRTATAADLLESIPASISVLGNRRAVAVLPEDVLEDATGELPAYFAAAAVAGLRSGLPPHAPLTNRPLSGLTSVSATRKLFTESQLDTLAGSGLWILVEDENGSIVTRHALTTDVSDLKSQTESYRTNIDNISLQIYDAMRPYIGRANISEPLLSRLQLVVEQLLDRLATSTEGDEVGPQVTDYELLFIRQNPLAANTIEVGVRVTGVFPNDYTDVFLNA